MGKCLVKSLQSSVADDTLLKLGEIRFEIISSGSVKIGLVPNKPNTLALVNSNGVITDTDDNVIGNSVAFPDGGKQSIKITATKGWLAVSDKYSISGTDTFGCLNVDVKDLIYCDAMESLNLPNCHGDVSGLKRLSKITNLRFGAAGNYCDVEGDLSEVIINNDITDGLHVLTKKSVTVNNTGALLNKINKVNKLMFDGVNLTNRISLAALVNNNTTNDYVLNLHNIPNITGSIESITKTNMAQLQLYNMDISGSLNNWFDLLHTAGKRGNFLLYISGCPNITYTGSNSSSVFYIVFGDSGWERVSNF